MSAVVTTLVFWAWGGTAFPIKYLKMNKQTTDRLFNILKDFSGLLITAALLNTLALHVSLLQLLKHGVGAPTPAQDLTGISSV